MSALPATEAAYELRALAAFNAMEKAEAEAILLRCCGSPRWARLMAALRPFHTTAALMDAAADVWHALAIPDWMQAFAAHPRIGAELTASGSRTSAWSAQEQAGTANLGAVARNEMEQLNEEYESRFGHRFLVSATGLSADDMLSTMKARITNDPSQELMTAAAEQARITELRLHKMLAELAES